MLIFLSIFTAYIFLFNFGIYIPARIYGVRIEKFYIWYDTYFSLFKFNIGNTEYGIGWLPLGGYVRISGMLLPEDGQANFEPYDFLYQSPFKRLVIILGGPLTNLILGVGIYSYFEGISISSFSTVAFQLLMIIFCFFFIFGVLSIFNKDREEISINRFQKNIYFILSLGLYLSVIYLFSFYINESIPFFDPLMEFLNGNYRISDILDLQNSDKLYESAAMMGIIFFIINLSPIGGFNGSKIIEILYESFSGRRISERKLEYYTILSFLFTIGYIIWLIYMLFQ